ncbi:MAG: YgeY family selenium metabolism-linked hydrolase [Alphaproteobacteria bacterium]|nr:YgeY family selenium metabolism-linked hydrolase [Rhodospirillaceae bacterium]MBT7613767.1 YgeY family selenium metabolism-linked hydrolase [Rhodospirillaceae bacterium]MDG2480918.1 YgeY family selenium metabolism-linked hydrolase [Alphaproteobacteria bacterium]
MDAVALTQKLVRIPGLSGEEGAVADAIEQTMRELGYREVTRDAMGTVLGQIGPEDAETCLLFDGHMDVVPVVGEWSVDPFGGEIRDGRLWGRGSTDMKGGLAAAICGVAAAAQRGELKHQAAVSATVLEEVIEGAALGAVMDRLDPRAVVICEPTSLDLKTAQKGRLEMLLTIHGKPSHAAYPERGVNAIDFAARALRALDAMTPVRSDELGAGILVPTDIISDPHPSISMLPNSVTIRFDRRTLVGENSEDILGAMRHALTTDNVTNFDLEITDSEVSTYTDETFEPLRWLPAWRLDRDHELVLGAMDAIRETGQEPHLGVFGFCTNGSESAGRRKVPTIGIGPGSEGDAHIIDESVDVGEVAAAAEIYSNLVTGMAGV